MKSRKVWSTKKDMLKVLFLMVKCLLWVDTIKISVGWMQLKKDQVMDLGLRWSLGLCLEWFSIFVQFKWMKIGSWFWVRHALFVFLSTSQKFIWDWDLNLGRKELVTSKQIGRFFFNFLWPFHNILTLPKNLCTFTFA